MPEGNQAEYVDRSNKKKRKVKVKRTPARVSSPAVGLVRADGPDRITPKQERDIAREQKKNTPKPKPGRISGPRNLSPPGDSPLQRLAHFLDNAERQSNVRMHDQLEGKNKPDRGWMDVLRAAGHVGETIGTHVAHGIAYPFEEPVATVTYPYRNLRRSWREGHKGPVDLREEEAKQPHGYGLDALLFSLNAGANDMPQIGGVLGVPLKGFTRGIEGMGAKDLAEIAGGLKYRGDTLEPAARSHFGRAVERAVDKARPITSKLPGVRSPGVKQGFEIGRSATNRVKLKDFYGRRLITVGKKLKKPEQYALRMVAEGRGPEEQIAFHAQQAAELDNPAMKAAHTIHAGFFRKAADLVEPDGHGGWQLSPKAGVRLHRAEHYLARSSATREDIYEALGLLEPEQIAERIQQPGRIIANDPYTADLEELKASDARYQLEQAVRKSIPDQADDFMASTDAQAIRLRDQTAEWVRNRIAELDAKPHLTPEETGERRHLGLLDRVGITVDYFYSRLDDAGVDFPEYIKQHYRQEWGDDNVLFKADVPEVAYSPEKVARNLRAKLNPRNAEKGFPQNPTIRRKGMVVVGRVTPRAWTTRVKKVLPTREARDFWARWYENFEPVFRQAFGEDADAVMRGFAASQANTSPAGGIGVVLKVMDRLRKGEEVTSEGIGMVAKAVEQAVQGTPLEKGMAAKLSDFADALAGRQTRTWMGHAAEGGQPAPADIWAARDLGHVDPKWAGHLERAFGLKKDVDFVVDSPGAPSGSRYERISEAYHDIADHLNAIGFDGRKDWNPAQVQALGWATVQKMVGVTPEDLKFALERNTRRVDFEMTQGPLGLGNDLSPEEASQVVSEMAADAERLVQETPGAHFAGISSDISGWAGGTNASAHVEVIAAEDTFHDLLTRFAQAFDQELVQGSREITRAGAKLSLVVSSPAFSDTATKLAFVKRLYELVPAFKPHGFMPADIDGEHAFAIITSKGYRNPAGRDEWARTFHDAIAQVEEEMGVTARYTGRNYELLVGGQRGRASASAGAGTVGGGEVVDPLAAEIRSRLNDAIERARAARSPERAAEVATAQAREEYTAFLDDVARTMGAKGKEVTDVQRAKAEAETLKFVERYPDDPQSREFSDLRSRAGVDEAVTEEPDWLRGPGPEGLVPREPVDAAVPPGEPGELAARAEPGQKQLHGVHVTGPSPGVREGQSGVYVSEITPLPTRVWVHEFKGHYTDRHWLTDEQRHAVDEFLGDDPEVFARAWEEWLLSIGDGRTPNVPRSLRPALKRLSEKALEETASHDGAAAARTWLPEAIADLFDTMHWYDEFAGGKYYVPDRRGLPTSWRSPLRSINQYIERVKISTGHGHKQVISLYGKDPSTTHEYRGFLKKMGFFKGDVTSASGEAAIKAARLGTLAEIKRDLLRTVSTAIPRDATDIPVKVNVAKDVDEKTRRVLDLLDDMELNRRKVSARDLKGVELDDIIALNEMHFPSELAGKKADRVAWEMINSEVAEPLENIRWIPRDVLMGSRFMNNPRAVALQNMGWGAEALLRTADMANNLVRATMLQLNPAYYTMNFLGNLGMNLIQQGPFALYNIPRAAFLSQKLGEDFAKLIDHGMGSGVTSIAELRWGSASVPGLNVLNHVASELVDTIPRRAAWLHEAYRLGLRNDEDLKHFLTEALNGNEDAFRVWDYINKRANDAIVDYERLNPFEKNVVARVIMFYPWIKGATRYTARFPLEHPIQASAMAALYAQQQGMASSVLGDRPYYDELDVPLGTVRRGGEDVPYVINPRQLLTPTTPLEMGQTLEGFLTGAANRQPLLENFTPVLQSGVEALAGRSSFEAQDQPQTFGSFLRGLTAPPAILNKIVELARNEDVDPNRLYPRNQFDRWMALAFGSLAPKPYNTEKGQYLAAGHRGKTPQAEWREKVDAFEKATGTPVPPRIQAAIETKGEWEAMKDEAHKHQSDLSEEDLARLKFELVLRHDPSAERYRASVNKYAADPEAVSRLDAALDRLLGWDELEKVSEVVNAYEKHQKKEQLQHASP